MKKPSFIPDFLKFLEASPTAYHAVEQVKTVLLSSEFEELDEKNEWSLKPSKAYFCRREGSLIAWKMPQKKIESALFLASHTDSPALKLKPQAEFIKEGMTLWGTEIYGSPLLSSWLNRDLGLAGKVLFIDKKDKVKEGLVNITSSPAIIPQLAIHLDREVNEKGLLLNKQEHLNAIATLGTKPGYLLKLLSEQLPIHEILSTDLFLYPLEAPRLIGKNEELISSYRLDSLASVWAILNAFISHEKPHPNSLQMVVFTDHEEIGSATAQGAESPFLSHLLERICISASIDRKEYLRLLNHALCVSVDLIHAINPNYPEKHDPQHKSTLGAGVIIKTSAEKRYATDIKSVKSVLEAAKKAKVPIQFMASRNDNRSGTTIGPIHASVTGIATADIGIGQLSMHSARELIAKADLLSLYKLIASLRN